MTRLRWLPNSVRRSRQSIPSSRHLAHDQSAIEIYERTTGIRFVAGLMAGLGMLALILAAFGIYGLMANSVAQRRHEFGVRMALGASSTEVLIMTVRQGVRLSAIGIVLGLLGAVWIARLIESELSGQIPSNIWLIVGTTVALGFVTLVAMVVPARRATRLDPAVVLKE